MRYFKTKTITLGFAVCLACQLANASVVVIANPNFPVQRLSKAQVASIFLGKTNHVARHIDVEAYGAQQGSAAYRQFYHNVVHWTADQANSYWSQQEFTGNGNAVPTVNNAADAVATVEQSKDAVAYVNSAQLAAVTGPV